MAQATKLMITFNRQRLISLFWIPSTYGFLGMLFTFSLYLIRLIEWDTLSVFTFAACVLAIAGFFVSSLFYMKYFWRLIDKRTAMWPDTMLPSVGLILVFYLVGIGGVAKYVLDYAAAMGGINAFVSSLLGQSVLIRAQAQLTQSIGTQLSYFGWIAIALTVLRFSVGRKVSLLLLLLLLVTFAGNLLWIDRTRPLTIVFMCIAVWLFSSRNLRIGALIRAIVILVVIGVGGFLLIGIWTGKAAATSNIYGITDVPTSVLNVYVYLTSGYPYLNRVFDAEPISFSVQRSIYPLAKIFSMLRLGPEPPVHVLEFFYVPFPTNVGTFMEMYYKETGILGVLFGIFIYCFGLNYIALKLLSSGRPLAIVAWSLLCWISLFAFFTPKIAATETWLIVGLGLLSMLPRLKTSIRIRKPKLHIYFQDA
jgi:oligosaccharide repeat unit polymerase